MSDEEKSVLDIQSKRISTVLQIAGVCLGTLFASIAWAVKQEQDNKIQSEQIIEIKSQIRELDQKLDEFNVNSIRLNENVISLTRAVDKLETKIK
jgi:hypothetical protein